MSEPIHTTGRAAERNVSPYLIEMPTNPVGIRLVPHMMAGLPVDQGNDEEGNPIGEQAALVKTGKLEIRFDGSSLPTKDAKGKPIDWEKVAYNAAQQAAYYRQVHDNLNMRAEEYERKYSDALRDYQNVKAAREEASRDLDRLRPLINAAFHLKNHWAYFLLPKSFRQKIGTV